MRIVEDGEIQKKAEEAAQGDDSLKPYFHLGMEDSFKLCLGEAISTNRSEFTQDQKWAYLLGIEFVVELNRG
jgi:hypothetical protein